jgi:hypothetical protein
MGLHVAGAMRSFVLVDGYVEADAIAAVEFVVMILCTVLSNVYILLADMSYLV